VTNKVVNNVPSKLCMCACARAQAVRRAHTRKLGVHLNIPSKNVCAHNFIHVVPSKDESW